METFRRGVTPGASSKEVLVAAQPEIEVGLRCPAQIEILRAEVDIVSVHPLHDRHPRLVLAIDPVLENRALAKQPIEELAAAISAVVNKRNWKSVVLNKVVNLNS